MVTAKVTVDEVPGLQAAGPRRVTVWSGCEFMRAGYEISSSIIGMMNMNNTFTFWYTRHLIRISWMIVCIVDWRLYTNLSVVREHTERKLTTLNDALTIFTGYTSFYIFFFLFGWKGSRGQKYTVTTSTRYSNIFTHLLQLNL